MAKRKFDGRNKYHTRYRDGLWIEGRKRVYVLWYWFLREAEKDPKRKVDWSKYEIWGGANEVMGRKFDDWWEDHWMELFGKKNAADDAKVPLTTKKYEYEPLRLAYLAYEYRHCRSLLEIAERINNREIRKRGVFHEVFWRGVDTKTEEGRRAILTGEGTGWDEEDDDPHANEWEERMRSGNAPAWEIEAWKENQEYLQKRHQTDGHGTDWSTFTYAERRDLLLRQQGYEIGKDGVFKPSEWEYQEKVGVILRRAESLFDAVCEGQFPATQRHRDNANRRFKGKKTADLYGIKRSRRKQTGDAPDIDYSLYDPEEDRKPSKYGEAFPDHS